MEAGWAGKGSGQSRMRQLGGKHVHTVQERRHKGAELTFDRTSQAQKGGRN